MLHYAITVSQHPGATQAAARRVKSACGRLGLSHNSHREATLAAKTLSEMQGVLRVVITRVREDHEATWIKGKQQ